MCQQANFVFVHKTVNFKMCQVISAQDALDKKLRDGGTRQGSGEGREHSVDCWANHQSLPVKQIGVQGRSTEWSCHLPCHLSVLTTWSGDGRHSADAVETGGTPTPYCNITNSFA